MSTSTYRNGSSKSINAQIAEREGRVTWSELPKAAKYGLTKAQAEALELNLGEWHHTSAFANRASYFDAEIIARVLNGLDMADVKEAATVAAKQLGFHDMLTGELKTSQAAFEAYSIIRKRINDEWLASDWTR